MPPADADDWLAFQCEVHMLTDRHFLDGIRGSLAAACPAGIEISLMTAMLQMNAPGNVLDSGRVQLRALVPWEERTTNDP